MSPRIIGAALALALAPANAGVISSTTDLAPVRAASERFRDVKVALAEGYVPAPGSMCETSAMMGRAGPDIAMGIHYFRPDLLGITKPPNPRVDCKGTHTDFLTPAVLIYEPQADGSLQLVAIENVVFKTAWEASGHKAPPSFMGVPYDYMADDRSTPADEAHGFAPHYDRHVWVYRDNPFGMFAQFNPNVSCDNALRSAGSMTAHSA